jgi:hypothetical protein
MVEISKSGSGEDLGWVTGPGYSTMQESGGHQDNLLARAGGESRRFQ